MEYVWMFIIGLAAGYIARALLPGRQAIGFWMTGILGVAGSFVASYAGQAIGWYKVGETGGFIASVVGAIVLLIVYTLVFKKSEG